MTTAPFPNRPHDLFQYLPTPVGVGQWSNGERDPEHSPEPLDSMVQCARLAAEDAGAPQALRNLDSLSFIAVMSREYRREPGRLAEMPGANPVDRHDGVWRRGARPCWSGCAGALRWGKAAATVSRICAEILKHRGTAGDFPRWREETAPPFTSIIYTEVNGSSSPVTCCS